MLKVYFWYFGVNEILLKIISFCTLLMWLLDKFRILMWLTVFVVAGGDIFLVCTENFFIRLISFFS